MAKEICMFHDQRERRSLGLVSGDVIDALATNAVDVYLVGEALVVA